MDSTRYEPRLSRYPHTTRSAAILGGSSARLEVCVNPPTDVLAVAANSTGGVTGKMISPQSIAVVRAAVGLVGRESQLLRFTVK